MDESTGDRGEKIRRQRRSTRAVKDDILDAVHKILREKGFSELGINLVAETAGVDRTVIYRNFGTFEQLLEQFAERYNHQLNLLAGTAELSEITKEATSGILENQINLLYRNRDFQNLLAWEISNLNGITEMIALRRERSSRPFVKQLSDYFRNSGFDIETICAIVTGGIIYLALHREHSEFYGVKMNSKEGKQRINAAVNQVLDLLFAAKDNGNERLHIARKMLAKGMDAETISEVTGISKEEVGKLGL